MKIVFFGDSLTDAGRNYFDDGDLGSGYVKIAAGKLRLLYPEKELLFLNRGVGGDRTQEVLARVEEVAGLAPDIVVLEVGINDVWCRFSAGVEVTPEEFSANYTAIVSRLLETGAKLILIQPFALPMGDKQRFRPYLKKFNEKISALAEEKKLPLIPMDEVFMGVTQDIDPAQFSVDGVHPTHRGCRYIADQVIKELRKYID